MQPVNSIHDMLLEAMRLVLRYPRLTRCIDRILQHFPRLRNRLMQSAADEGLIGGAALMASSSQANQSDAVEFDPTSPHLTEPAKHIYRRLRRKMQHSTDS